jgi:hypothetical protein
MDGGSDLDSELIDGHPLPFGSYAPWVRPISVYGREGGGQRYG